jgi:hypothetical protein
MKVTNKNPPKAVYMDAIKMPTLEHHRILPDKKGCAVVRFKTDHHVRKIHEVNVKEIQG